MQNNNLERNIDFVDKLDAYPEELFSDSFKETINVTKTLFKENMEYIDKSLVKCCVVGKTSTGKSTLINALLKADILCEGDSKSTLCAAKCQSSSNDEEYFKIHEGYDSLDQKMRIDDIKNINFRNINYSNFTMNANNYLDIFLNASQHEILQNFLLIDCPGFDDNNMDAISKYCEYADIMIFCFRAKAGITDRDIENILKLKKNIGKFHTNFIINCCDECDSINKVEISNKLSPHLTGEYAIYFISAREERRGMLNNERHGEFEQFKKCLQKKQKSLAKVTFHKVYLDLICSIKKWSIKLGFRTIGEYRFSDEIFTELQQEIIKLINNDTKKYYKNDSHIASMEYSEKANKAISNFIIKQFIKDHHLNDGIIGNYFYKRFMENNAINNPIFSWYEFGVKNEEMKKNFLVYFTDNSSTIKEKIDVHYKERVKTIIEELGKYKNELQNITKQINELVME